MPGTIFNFQDIYHTQYWRFLRYRLRICTISLFKRKIYGYPLSNLIKGKNLWCRIWYRDVWISKSYRHRTQSFNIDYDMPYLLRRPTDGSSLLVFDPLGRSVTVLLRHFLDALSCCLTHHTTVTRYVEFSCLLLLQWPGSGMDSRTAGRWALQWQAGFQVIVMLVIRWWSTWYQSRMVSACHWQSA